MNPVLQAENLADMYRRAAETYGDSPAFFTRDANKNFNPTTYKEIYEMGAALATALTDLGVQSRDHVSLLADNRLEWIVCTYGIHMAGAASVPRGTDVTDQDIQYIIPHSDAKVVFVEDAATLKKVQNNLGQLPNVKTIIMMDKDTKPGGDVLHLYDLIEKGKKMQADGNKEIEKRIEQIQPDDLFTLIYTSGTTGAPKGVQLMHKNMISQVRVIPVPVQQNDRILSILPVWHVFELVFEMIAISKGAPTYYTNIRNIREDMASVKPTFMASAPRLWENVYLGIRRNIDSAPAVRQKLFNAAYFCARMVKGSIRFLSFKQLDLTGRNPIVSLVKAIGHIFRIIIFALPYAALNAIVLSKIRAATGGQLRGSVSGGGALPLHVDEFFNNIGIPVLEGYGMTETSPVLAVRTFPKLVIGSVGPIFPNTDIRLVDPSSGNVIYPPKKGVKGEIHAKGPQVMKGYYKNPEATEKVLNDGWMNTGDLGIITYNNTLKIVGRSKETVVLLGGENVEPVPIENKIVQSALVDQCMVVGQDKKTLAALIVVNPDMMKDYGETLEEIAKNKEAEQMIREEVKTLISGNNGFKSFERVTDVRLLPKPFEVGDELTNIFKIKRHIVTDKYTDLIESMYD